MKINKYVRIEQRNYHCISVLVILLISLFPFVIFNSYHLHCHVICIYLLFIFIFIFIVIVFPFPFQFYIKSIFIVILLFCYQLVFVFNCWLSMCTIHFNIIPIIHIITPNHFSFCYSVYVVLPFSIPWYIPTYF